MLDFLNYRFDTLSLILVIFAIIMLLLQLFFYIAVYGRMLSYFRKCKKKNNSDNEQQDNVQGVSVIMVTNNNGDALRECLLHVLEQDYPLFEVVVVNENSTDDTEFILYVLKNNYPNLTVINLERNDNKFDSYKFSLSIGIRSAKYSTVLLTDVSCASNSYNWISKMMAPVNTERNKKFVTGICLRHASKGFAKYFEQYDQATDYMNLISYTLLGNAYTSCGMNMCYNKEMFIEKGGLIPQYALNCKQEDYFVHRYSTKQNMSIVLDKDAFVYLPSYNSFNTFIRVKFANSLSHKYLANRDKILLALNPISSFFFYALSILLLVFSFPWQYIVILCVIKWITQIVTYKKCMKKLDMKKNWLFTPLLEIFFYFFNFIIRIRVLFYRKREKKIRWDK